MYAFLSSFCFYNVLFQKHVSRKHKTTHSVTDGSPNMQNTNSLSEKIHE